MEWDLGLQGIGVLAGLSVGFGLLSIVVLWNRATPWLSGTAGAVVYFVAGLLISEAWFGWATAEDLQPNIDGLSFDEVLLAYPVGIVLLLAVRYLLGRRTYHAIGHT